MMKRFICVLVLLSLALSTQSLAQGDLENFLRSRQVSADGNMMVLYKGGSKVIIGTPFFNDSWRNGSITASGGNTFNDVTIKFDSHSSLVMVKHRGDSLYLYPQVISEFTLNTDNGILLFKNGHYDEKLKLDRTKYLQVLQEGYWSLYKDVQKQLKEADFDPVFQIGSRDNQFVENVRYLFVNPKGEWNALPLRRRQIERFFGDELGKVREYVRANNLNIESEADLSKIFEYLNK
jgi:hypothetical protein